MTWIQTTLGLDFDIMRPDENKISVFDISCSLARKCRFGGNVRHDVEIYTVAQHSVFVCDLVDDPKLKLPALLHDAHEVYNGFGDVLSPAKQLDRHVTDFIEMINRSIDTAIAKCFGFSHQLFQSDAIKRADMIALATERTCVMERCSRSWGLLFEPSENPFWPWGIKRSQAEWMRKFNELTNENGTAKYV